MRQSHHRSAFTLLDLIFVLAILGILLFMSFGVILGVREAANRASCQGRLKCIGIAIHNYASTYGDRLPPMLDYLPDTVGWSPFWFSLYPYLESTPVYRRASGTGVGWNAGNHAFVLTILLCPSDKSHKGGLCTSGAVGWAGTSYAPVFQLFGTTSDYNEKVKAHITAGKYKIDNVPDGTSQQAAIVERFVNFPSYGSSNATLYPQDAKYWGWNNRGSVYGVWGLKLPQTNARSSGPREAHPFHPNSAHSTLQILRLDGTVLSSSSSVDPKTWERFCTPDDGNREPPNL